MHVLPVSPVSGVYPALTICGLHSDGFSKASGGENGVGAEESREAKEVVQNAIQQLNPTHRAAVVLRMIDGYSTKETAEILGIPSGTVLSRLARAMDALKPLLEPYANDYET